MKINLDYYNENNEKDIEIVKDNTNSNFEVLRKNIISWYPFKENATILEIGAKSGFITEELCKHGKKVTSIAESKKQAEMIGNYNKNKKNLEIVVGKLSDITLNIKFDYIIILGAEELNYDLKVLLEYSKNVSNENSIILLATDNKLGVKHFSTLNNNGEKMTNSSNTKLLTLSEIEDEIKEAEFNNYKIYYPLTDYKLTNVIFTNDYFLSKTNLSRNIPYNDVETIKFYNENDVFEEFLAEENLCKSVMNSYLFEIFEGDYNDNDIKMISYSNMRKKEYRIKTIVMSNFVYKYALDELSVKHIKKIKENIDIMKKNNIETLDSYDNEKIISQYSKDKTFDRVLIDVAKKDKEKAIELLKNYKNNLLEKLEKSKDDKNVFDKYGIDYDKENIENFIFVKNGLWDLIFQNCFFIDSKFFFYDQEWREENIPIEFIFYRAVKYMGKIKKYIHEKDIYELFNINEKNIEILDKLDDKLQEVIRDDEIWTYSKNGKNIDDLRIELLTKNHQINLLTIELGQKNNELENIRKENEELKKGINSIKNSKSWKVIQAIRKIKRKK